MVELKAAVEYAPEMVIYDVRLRQRQYYHIACFFQCGSMYERLNKPQKSYFNGSHSPLFGPDLTVSSFGPMRRLSLRVECVCSTSATLRHAPHRRFPALRGPMKAGKIRDVCLTLIRLLLHWWHPSLDF